MEIKNRFDGKTILKIEGDTLIKANLRGADLLVANLSEANLTQADLSEADLSEADLRGADLSGAKGVFIFNYGVRLQVVNDTATEGR